MVKKKVEEASDTEELMEEPEKTELPAPTDTTRFTTQDLRDLASAVNDIIKFLSK